MTAATALTASQWAALTAAGTDVTVAPGTVLDGATLGLAAGDYVLLDTVSGAVSPPVTVAPFSLATLTLSASAVAENSPADTLVGVLVGTRPGSTLALTDGFDPDGAGPRFKRVGLGIHTTAVPYDFEAEPLPAITVTETVPFAANSPNASILTLAGTDVAEGPRVVSVSPADGAAGVSLTTAYSVTFDRPPLLTPEAYAGVYNDDAGQSLVMDWYQPATGTGPGQATISGNTVTFHPSSTLAAADAFYFGLVPGSVKDAAGNLNAETVYVSFATGSAPLIAGPSGAPGVPSATASVPEKATAPRVIHTYTSTVPSTWSLAGGADAGDFAINPSTGALTLNATGDFEGLAGKTGFTVVVRATALSGGATTDQTLTLAVTDVAEGEPVLTVTGFSDATKALTVDLSEAATLHWASHPAGSPPTRAQLVAGTGGGLYQAGSFAASSGVAQTLTLTEPTTPLGVRGLSLMAMDGSGNPSAIVTTTFTMVAAGDATAPVLTSPGAAPSGAWSVTTDEGNGALYAVATVASTPPTAAQVRAGQNASGAAAVASASQAVSSTGAKTGTFAGLGPGTYTPHFMHEDASGNRSAVVSGASFTVSGAGTGTSLNVRMVQHAEAEQAGSDITWTAVPVDPAATTLVALVTYRGPGNVTSLKVGGLAATLIGSVASAGGTVSQTRAYQVAAPGGWTTADVLLDGQSAATGSGLLTLLSLSGLASASLTGAAPVNGATSAAATQDVVAGDALYAHLWGTAATFTGLTWSGVAPVRPAEPVASDAYHAAVAGQAVASTAAGYAVGATWTNTTSNNLLLGVLRLRGS